MRKIDLSVKRNKKITKIGINDYKKILGGDYLTVIGCQVLCLARTDSTLCLQTPTCLISLLSHTSQRTHSLKSIASIRIAPVGQAFSQTLHTSHCGTRLIFQKAATLITPSDAPSGQA